MRRGTSWWTLGGVLFWAGTAAAQPQTPDVRGFRPPLDPNAALYTETTSTPGSGEWTIGAWASYAYRPLRLEGAGADSYPLRHQLSVDYLAAIGLFDRFAVGAALPTVVYQSGDRATPLGEAGELPRARVADPLLELKATLIRPDALGGFGLAALGRVTLPIGQEESFISEPNARGELRLLSELRLVALNLYATAGARLRADETEWLGEEFGHDLPWGAGLSFAPKFLGIDPAGRFRWNAEIRGAVALSPEFARARQSPVLGALSARYTVGDVSVLAGVELALNSGIGAPSVRPVLALGWAPRFYDADQDGIADDDDECPELAEDRDGFEDHDGCPDFDNDGDGVYDEEDRCPKQQEDEDEFEDGDGCIDPDNDGDGIPDVQDACPAQKGPASPDAKSNGCVPGDGDQDGLLDRDDRCASQPEDKDGFQDEDGCPDPDNDADHVPDSQDACPSEPAGARPDPRTPGCPHPDRDGDTYDGGGDRCPDQAEDFDGDQDEDGCPDPDSKTQPLLGLDPTTRALRWRIPLAFTATDGGVELEPARMSSVRALAQVLTQNPGWVALVGVRPVGASREATQQALNRAFSVVHAIRGFTRNDESAEIVGFRAVETQPDAARTGVGVWLIDGAGRRAP